MSNQKDLNEAMNEESFDKPEAGVQKDTPRYYFGLTIKTIQCLYSCAILAFSIAVVMTGNPDGKPISGAGGIILFWVLVIWLAYLEGGQNALVGLQPVEKDKYGTTHKVTLMSTAIAHRDGNMERFIIGRQLVVVVVVFVINLCGSIKSGCSTKIHMAGWLEEVACGSGLAMIVITLLLGQLTSQIICAKYMLEFINNYLMVATTYISLAVEYSGLLHSVYLVQMMFELVTKKKNAPPDPKKEELSLGQKIFFWARVCLSLVCLIFAFAVHLSEIGKGRTNMWASVPAPASIAIFFILMIIVGHLEGMQIALFSVMKADPNVPRTAFAQAACNLAFRGSNLRKIVVGRQMLATVCMFVIARITSVDADHPDFHDNHETSLGGIGDGLQGLVFTNLLAALITTIVASLSFRIIASVFPMVFLSNPMILIIMRVCLFLEATGLMHFAWVLAKLLRRVLRYKTDEEILTKARSTVANARAQL